MSTPNESDVGTLATPVPDLEERSTVAVEQLEADGGEAPLRPLRFKQRYRLDRVLGEGGMGVVRLCHDQQIGRNVAMKEVRPDRVHSRRGVARFVREARVQGQLEHPAIVPVYDLGVAPDGAVYFTMKRVRGVTLEEILEKLRRGDEDTQSKWGRRRLLSAFANVCLAVDFAHERGVVHRDLKPDNIMLGDFGEVYVLDWGVAKTVGERETTLDDVVDLRNDPTPKTVEGAILGTPGYVSPEQLGGNPERIGPRSDVYSLGTILFELLTLEKLHSRGRFEDLARTAFGGVNARPSERVPEADVPPELEAICVKSTEFDARDRFGSARAVQEALEAFLAGERDVELRRDMARRHAGVAKAAAERARAQDATLDERRRAMREVGRALALDPDNTDAMQAMVDLLTEPPAGIPDEVDEQLRRSTGEQVHSISGLAAVAYLSMFLYLPLLLWAGVRDALSLVAFYTLCVVSGLMVLVIWRVRRPTQRGPLAVMFTSNVAFAFSATFFGPLVLAPGLIAINTMAFAIFLQRPLRRIAVAFGCLVIIVPVMLQLGGMLPPSYAFSPEGMMVIPRAIGISEAPTIALLLIGNVAVIVTGAVSVGRIRDALADAERRLYLHTWHLRQLVPGLQGNDLGSPA